MAIEIIPKKPEAKRLDLFSVLFYVCIVLLVVFVVGSFALSFYQKKLSQRLETLIVQIAAKGTPEELALEKMVLETQKKINVFSELTGFHQASSKFFESLESITHPKLFFSKVNLRTGEGIVSLSGTAENFEALGQQYLIFKSEDYIKKISLSKALIGEEGQVDFVLDISFVEGEFKY